MEHPFNEVDENWLHICKTCSHRVVCHYQARLKNMSDLIQKSISHEIDQINWDVPNIVNSDHILLKAGDLIRCNFRVEDPNTRED